MDSIGQHIIVNVGYYHHKNPLNDISQFTHRGAKGVKFTLRVIDRPKVNYDYS